MKANKITHKNRLGAIAILLAALAVVGVAAFICFDKVRDLYLDQTVIRDFAAQVEITSGKMVKADVIAENLGLKKGANLSTIDFPKRCDDLLKRVPNLQSIHVTRKLPDKISVVTEERIPIARLGSGKETGRVVDSEGMVFIWQRGTQALPLIRESQGAVAQRGTRVTGRTLAALRLIEACSDAELLELGVLEVDMRRRDFLVVTLGSYSKVKILWDEMDESTPHSRADMIERLTNLRNAIRTQTTPPTVIWNATIPHRVFADTQENI